MRAVVQRVREARVEVDGQITGAIEKGLLVFLGVGRDDNRTDGEFMADKLANLRIFRDDDAPSPFTYRIEIGCPLVSASYSRPGMDRRGHAADEQARSSFSILAW